MGSFGGHTNLHANAPARLVLGLDGIATREEGAAAAHTTGNMCRRL